MSSGLSKKMNSAPKMQRPSVTGAFLLKQKPIHLLYDLKEIIEKSGVKLSASCSRDLAKFLEEKLEPHALPYDPKRPGLQQDLDNSSRLRDVKARFKDQGATTKSFRPPNPDKYNPFNTRPRNIHESFMDKSWDDDSPPRTSKVQEVANASRFDTMYRVGPFDEVLNRVHPPRVVKEPAVSALHTHPASLIKEEIAAATKTPVKIEAVSPVASGHSIKKECFEHGPEGVNASFYLPHDSTAFSKLLPKVDRSAYDKASLIQERADDYLDVGEDEFTERAPPVVTKDKSLLLDHSADSSVHGQDKLHPNIDGISPRFPIKDDITAAAGKRTSDAFKEMDASVVSFTSNDIGAFGKIRPHVTQTPPAVPVIKVTGNTFSASQSSAGSSGFSGFQWSPAETKKVFQDTPDSTIFDLSQGASTKIPSAASPTDHSNSSGMVASSSTGRVEINPRRSARLAKTSAPASSAPPAPSMVPPPAPVHGAKRGRKADIEDDSSHPSKKVVTKATVVRQRDTRREEAAKRGGSRRRSVLERRRL